MDLRRFVDLYVSETQEHIHLLQRSIVAYGDNADADALAEAFRAAHTLKGISAAMGYGRVADLAHAIEDRLDALRKRKTKTRSSTIDALLVAADELEDAIDDVVRKPPEPVDGAVVPDVAAVVSAPLGPTPAGTATIAHVRLRADAPIKGARAAMIMSALADVAGVIGSDPATFDEDFAGAFRIFLAADANAAKVEQTIRSAGEVDVVEITASSAAAAQSSPEPLALLARQVRVDPRRLDRLADGLGELSVLHARLQGASVGPQVRDMFDRIGMVLADLEHDMRALRMVPVREVFERLPRIVRDAARAVKRDVELELEGDDVELDRSILDEIVEPLTHMLRNAVDHGIENAAERRAAAKRPRGRICVRAERERGSVRIEVEDDGRGVSADRIADKARAAGIYNDAAAPATDEDLFRLMSMPGLSTADTVSAVSGRGVGMDAVVNRVRMLGGAIDMRTTPGTGTRFTLRLPISLATAQALRVRVGGEDYAIPLTHVTEAIDLEALTAGADAPDDTAIGRSAGRESVRVRSRTMPLVRLRRVLRIESEGRESAAVITELGGRRAALAVDELVGREQIVIRTFDAVRGMLPYFSGATLLADGRPALVLDPLSVV